MYTKCGSPTNNMSSAEARVFSCEPNAKGSSLKIQIKGRRDYLTLCEVFIFGRGKIEVKCDIEINNGKIHQYIFIARLIKNK